MKVQGSLKLHFLVMIHTGISVCLEMKIVTSIASCPVGLPLELYARSKRTPFHSANVSDESLER
jgi:hypothetical protein